MISDWRDWGHVAEGQKEKRSRDPLSPNKFSPDNRTHPARRTPKPRCLIAAFQRQSMPATQDDSRAPSELEKLNIFKTCCTNHANQSFLVRKLPNRFWQVFISTSRTAEPSSDCWQQS